MLAQDVKFELAQQQEPIVAGAEFNIVINVTNTCRYERTMTLVLTLAASYYTGLTSTRLKSQQFNFNLCALRS